MHIPFITRVVPFLFPFLEPHFGPSHSPPPDRPRTLTFQPIHAHSHTFSNSSTKPRLFFHNASAPTTCLFVPDSGSVEPEVGDETNLLDNPSPKLAASPLTIRTTPITVRRPRIRPPSISSWAISARNQQHITINISESWVAPDYADDKGDWEDVEVLGPDIRDRQTLLALAKMSSNAYTIPDGGEWWPVDGWNETMPFGWEPDSDGLRGHVVSLLPPVNLGEPHQQVLVRRSDQLDSDHLHQRDIRGGVRRWWTNSQE